MAPFVLPTTSSAVKVAPEYSKLRSGIFGDIFDILQRPNAAIAGATRNYLDDSDITTLLGGFKEGITGAKQTSFSDVLADQGVGGWKGALGGMALDVALDPLTYIGVKKTTGTTKTKALVEALQTGADNVDNVAAEIMAKNPSRVGLTVAGFPIGSVKWQRDGKIAQKLLGPSTDRKTLVQAFSREATLPEGLNELSRVIESSHSAKFDDFRGSIKRIFSEDLTPEERQMISFSIDDPASSGLSNVPVDKANARFKNLGDYEKLSRRIMDDAYLQEAQLGLFDIKKGAAGKLVTDYEGYNPNYVYRYFKKPPSDLLPGEILVRKGKISGPDSADFMKQRKKNVSLRAAEELGYEPITDIADILDLRMAKHYRTMQRGTLVRDAVDQFGADIMEYSKLPKGSQVRDLNWIRADQALMSPVAQKYKNKMIPEFVARALNQSEAMYTSPTVGSKMMKGFDKATQQWKFLNTGAMPGYHIRNSFSDYIMNWADGVKNPQRYSQAIKVLKDRKDIADQTLLQLMDPTATVVPVGKESIKIGGNLMSSDEVWKWFTESGSKSGIVTTELRRSLDPQEAGKILSKGSKVKAWIGDKGDAREDFFRMAHFIDAFDSEARKAGASLEKASKAAAKRVRKYNIDYGNLSPFEKNTVNKIIPFYSWMRRATPLNVEMLFTKPGFMALYPKGQNLAQGLLGTQDENGEQLIPQWIQDMAPVRIARAKEADRNPLERFLAGVVGAGNNEPAFISTTTGTTPFDTLDLPLEPIKKLLEGDITGAIRSPIADLSQSISPFIKTPIELGTGRSTFSGQEIDDWGTWLASQIAPGRAITQGIDQSIGGSVANSVFGVPIKVATADRQEGEFRRRQAANQQVAAQEKLKTLRNRFSDFDNFSEARQEALKRGVRTRRDPEELRQRRYLTQVLGQ